jgi:hypothetical protein
MISRLSIDLFIFSKGTRFVFSYGALEITMRIDESVSTCSTNKWKQLTQCACECVFVKKFSSCNNFLASEPQLDTAAKWCTL